MQTTIELLRQVRAASVRANSYDEASNTIDVVWTTGATVRRASWMDGPYDEKLLCGPENVRLDRLNLGASFLDTHDSFQLASVIGSVVPGTARMVDGQGVATIALSRAAGCADVVQNIKDGIIRNISVGYLDHAVEKLERDDGSVPLWTVTDWEPFEISAVPVPADAGAQIRSGRVADGTELFPCRMTRADTPTPKTEAALADAPKPADAGSPKDNPNNNASTSQPSAAAAADVAKKVDEAKTPKDATAVVDPGDASPIGSTEIRRLIDEALGQERARAADILKEGDRFGMRALAEEHIRSGTKVKAFRGLILDKLAERTADHGGPQGTSQRAEPTLSAERGGDDRSAGAAMAKRLLGKK